MTDLTITLLQIVVVIVAARAATHLLRHLKQPPVIVEIVAGILLGPSAFGRFAPHTFALLFPKESLAALQSLSTIGLILFMFLVGLEFAPELMRERRKSIVVISHVSIVIPFVLGSALAFYLYPRVSEASVSFRSFALFLGIAMSITAFPVLARILGDRQLLRTRTGNTVIACAAVDDVTAWCILAFVVMLVRAGDPSQFVIRLGMLAAYIAVMLAVIRPLMRELLPRLDLFAALLLLLASACATEVLGMHALFGAFLAGTVVPREGRLRDSLVTQMRGLTSMLFLPLFFAVTGLRTNVGLLLDKPSLWICCAVVLAVAIVGKLGGATVAAAAAGLPWREAAAIGILMNTRGLMELVVLNIGLDVGVISPSLFTMVVIMALVTTAMTAPLLDIMRIDVSMDRNQSVAEAGSRWRRRRETSPQAPIITSR